MLSGRLMRSWIAVLVAGLCGCSHDVLDDPGGDDLGVPVDMAPSIDLIPSRDLHRLPDLLPRPDLLGPVPPLRFAPPLYQGTMGGAPTVGDFNNDGRLDVAALGFRYVSVTLQRPGGYLLPIDTPYEVSVFSNDYYQFAVADFDGDGTLDAVIAPWAYHTGQVFFGTGDGRFRDGPRVTLSANTNLLVAEDVDGDGKADLIAHSIWPLGINDGKDQAVRVLRGKGDGTFGPAAIYKASRGNDIVVADLNGDGKRDIAVANDNGTITILVGVGDGTFLPAVYARSGPSGVSVAAADFDRDGRDDLVVGSADRVVPMLSTNNGLVAGATVPLVLGTGIRLLTGDWNRDGNPDFAATGDRGPRGLITFLGDGKGGFVRGAEAPISEPGPAVAADLDGDGDLDLVVGAATLENDGAGHFGTPRRLPDADFAVDTRLADLDEDGLPDVVTMLPNELAVFPAAGNGRYREGTRTAIPGGSAFAIGAIDGDAHLDLVAMPGSRTDRMTFWPGRGDGAFGAPVAGRPTSRMPDPRPPVLGDLDGDGWLDLAVVSAWESSLSLLFGDSGGGFRGGKTFFFGAFGSNPVLGDWNGDGRLDVAVASSEKDTVLVFAGQGGGVFADPRSVGTGLEPRQLSAADFDGDGLLDLATANGEGSVSVLRGTPGGGFLPHVDFALDNDVRPALLTTADLNGDLRPDLAVAASEKLFVLAGNGDGTLQAPLTLPIARYPSTLDAVDVDGDGDIDLVTTDGDRPFLATCINQMK